MSQGVTVKELIDILLQERQDAFVVLSRDEEGNGFNYFSDIGVDSFSPSDGELLLDEDDWKEEYWDQEDPDDTYASYLERYGAVPAVVLWP